MTHVSTHGDQVTVADSAFDGMISLVATTFGAYASVVLNDEVGYGMLPSAIGIHGYDRYFRSIAGVEWAAVMSMDVLRSLRANFAWQVAGAATIDGLYSLAKG